MEWNRLEPNDIARLLTTTDQVGATGSVGSGLWAFEDDFPGAFRALEPNQLAEYPGDILVFFTHHTDADLVSWLQSVDPHFDVAQLRLLPPRTALHCAAPATAQ